MTPLDEARAEIKRLREVGQLMSNILYNISQSEANCDLLRGDPAKVRQLVRSWDAIQRTSK